jgi:hypothetical protein
MLAAEITLQSFCWTTFMLGLAIVLFLAGQFIVYGLLAWIRDFLVDLWEKRK